MTSDRDRGLRTSDFEYELAPELIARHPAARRDQSRLLVLDRSSEDLADRRFSELGEYMRAADALVLNDTRVFPARLRGRKPTGAPAEILLLRPLTTLVGGVTAAANGAHLWEAFVRPGGKLKPGRCVDIAPGFAIRIEDSTDDGGRIVRFLCDKDPWDLIERHGSVPLPPYLEREPEAADRERYQTVYARSTGSVAAPTAGLHFTAELLDELEASGIRIVRITLHVGPGTFRPVSAEEPADHRLQPEYYRVSPDDAAALNAVRAGGGRVVAVGTTSVRTLETVVDEEGRFHAAEGFTELFVRPPYTFRGVDALVTNFHLPRSSLIMLVAAFAGLDRTLEAYHHAVEERYRFYSYGDAMLVL